MAIRIFGAEANVALAGRALREMPLLSGILDATGAMVSVAPGNQVKDRPDGRVIGDGGLARIWIDVFPAVAEKFDGGEKLRIRGRR